MKDKYGATWVSHSSMSDFLKCPRAYYLRNVYKSPETNRKMTIANGPLSLGQAVHTVLESLKTLPTEDRLKRDLLADLDTAWEAVHGKKGGFKTPEEEEGTKSRARAMIARVIEHPGPIAKKTVRLKESANGMPPNFYLSGDENIVLCGLIDWLEYREEDDSIRVVDFKTGKNEEDTDSLQLPIYTLLLHALQKRPVSGAAYWYLDKDDEPVAVELPPVDISREKILEVARRVKDAREQKLFACPRGEGGCFNCRPFEAILRGEGACVGVGSYGQDIYVL